ncbi:MAG: HAD hydrolase family protein, partial [Erysipelotrichaceae bacterium]|nr:HAD hydrolase family protein [Erysipelotrichaceae bacterium]
RFKKEYLMIQPDEKLEGIERMLELTGGDAGQVVVFGDDLNDLVMFDRRFVKVAMGNGHELLKEKADFVADRNVNDGIWKICEQQGWFEPVQE